MKVGRAGVPVRDATAGRSRRASALGAAWCSAQHRRGRPDDAIAVEKSDIGDGALADDCIRAGEQGLIEAVTAGPPPERTPPPGAHVFVMRDPPPVGDPPKPPPPRPPPPPPPRPPPHPLPPSPLPALPPHP